MATKIRGITIELGADASGVVESLKSVNSQIKSTSQQLKDVDKLLKLDPTNTELLEQKTGLLKDQISQTKEKLDTLKQAQQTMDENGVDENSAQYQALQREIIATEQELDNLKSTAGSGSETLAKISTVTGEWGDKLTTAGEKMMPISLGIAAFGTAAVAAFNEVDSGMDIVIKKTGATGEAAEGLEESYKNVATSVVGDFDDIGGAVGEVNTRFGLTGTALEELSTTFLKFANINDLDVQTAVEGVDQAMKTFNVDQSEANNVMGLLTVTAQNTGISMDELLNNLQQYGPALKEMGLDIGDAIELMGSFEEAGIDSSDMLSKLQKAAAYYNSEGLSMEEGLSDLIARLQDSDTAADATAEAYEIFGKRGGLAFIQAAQEGKLSIGDLEDSMDDYSTAVDDTYNETMDGTDEMALAWQSLQVSMSELGEAIGNVLAPIMTKISEFISGLAEWFSNLDEDSQNLIVTIGLVVAAIGPLLMIGGKVLSGISSISSALSTLGNSTWGPIALVVAAVAGLVTGLDLLFKSFANEAWENSPFREELERIKGANEDLQKAIEDTKSAYTDSTTNTEAEAAAAESLNTKLQSLIESYDGSAEKQAEIQILVDALNKAVPDLGLAWDENTNSLNLNTEEIYNQISAMKAQAQVAALTDFYTESLKEQYLAEKNLSDAQAEMNEVLGTYGLTQEDITNYLSNDSIPMQQALSSKIAETCTEGFNFSEVMKECTMAVDNYTDASDNATASSENVTYAESELANAMMNAAAAANNSTAAIIQRYEDTFGQKIPARLELAIVNAKDAGVKIPQSIVDGLMNGQLSVDEATQAITELMDKSEEAKEKGEATGQAYAQETAQTITDEDYAIEQAAEDAMDGLDQGESASSYGEDVADEYVGAASDGIYYSTDIEDAADDAVSKLDKSDDASGYGDDIGSQYDSAIAAWKDPLSTTLSDMSNRFYTVFGIELPPFMGQWGYNAGDRFNSNLSLAGESVAATASTIASNVESAFSSLGWKLEGKGYLAGSSLSSGLSSATQYIYDNMLVVGNNAMIGFNNGMVAMEQLVYDTASTIANNAVGVINNALQINSPSKVMERIGEYAGEGLAIGLENSTESIDSAMDSMADSITNLDGVNALNADSMNVTAGITQQETSRAEIASMMSLLSQYLPYLAEQQNIVLDDGTLAGHMAPAMNDALASLKERTARG